MEGKWVPQGKRSSEAGGTASLSGAKEELSTWLFSTLAAY